MQIKCGATWVTGGDNKQSLGPWVPTQLAERLRSDHIAAHLWLHNNSSGDASAIQLADMLRG